MEFALKLYKQLSTANSENIFFSPFSISNVLSMLALGSDGKTLEQIEQALGWDSGCNFHENNRMQLKQVLAAGQNEDNLVLEIGNKLCTDKTFALQSQFVDKCLDVYNGETENMDFRGNPDECRQVINAWIEKVTRSKITDILPSGSIRPDTSLVLANAVYFKGKWDDAFDPRDTWKGKFHVEKGKTVEVEMMAKQRNFGISYDEKLRLQVLEVPYKGMDTVLLLLVPTQTFGLAEIEKQLDHELLSKLAKNVSYETVRLNLPRMKVEQQITDLDDKLRKLGLKHVFDPSSANLSKISPVKGLHVSTMAHKAMFEVNEEGSEAAAATVAISVMSLPIAVTCDHPFMFILKHKPSDAVLFVGRFTGP